jgi:ribonuclease P protein component
MPSIHTLSRNERLKSRKLISRVFTEGEKIRAGNLLCRYLAEKKPGLPPVIQVGVTVSSRQFAKAVDRNRIKRQVRECWRVQKDGFASMRTTGSSLYVFFIYTGTGMPAFDSLQADMTSITGKLRQKYSA